MGIYFKLLILNTIVLNVYLTTGLVLKNNGYEGFTIIIKETVQEDKFNEIVESIKLRFTEASRFLFKATKQRAYFRQITIVIPRSWRARTNIEKISSVNIFSEHLRIEPTNSTVLYPYVRGNLECGRPAWYMRLDPKWLFESQTFDGLHEKAIVHEWSHLRWGLFDEYASINHKKSRNPNHKIYFDSIDRDGLPKPVACTRGIQGEAKRDCNSQEVCSPKDALEDPDCKFCPRYNQPNIKASIMSYVFAIPGIDEFCDVDNDSVPENLRHDASSRNAQNAYCNGRSTWEVMRDHDDFKDERNPPLPADTIITPTFKVVQEGGRTRVFVLDTSSSMKGDKILQQKDAAHLAINTVIQTGSCLGIVEFTDEATIRAPMTYVDGPDKKRFLQEKIPAAAEGNTQILIGLVTAIQIIEQAELPCSKHTTGAEIVLLSDGESNDPYLEEISPSLVENGIIVHTVAITDAADRNMTELARRTGGKSFTYLQTQTVSLSDALAETLTTNDYSSDSPEKIMVSEFIVHQDSPVRGSYTLEEGFGNHTVMTVEMNNASLTTLSLREPSGKTLFSTSNERTLVIEIQGTAEVGSYNFTLKTDSTTPLLASFAMFSQPVSTEVDVVRVTSRLTNDTVDFNVQDEIKLYVEVTKGVKPVLNADVTAVLDAGAGFEPVGLVLDDNGTGADTVKNDGIYSVYLLKKYFTKNSLYNIKIWVTSTDHTIAYEEALGKGALSTNVYYEPVPIEKFQRQSIPPLINIVNFVINHTDNTPPARIIDLDVAGRWEEIHDNDPTNGSIKFMLVWTAVGDDMTEGQATKYDIRMDNNPTVVRMEFDKAIPVPANLTTPLKSGQKECLNLTLSLSDCNGTCYVAIRSCDKAGQWSEVSNILPVVVRFINDPHRHPLIQDDSRLVIVISVTSGVVLVVVVTVSLGFYLWLSKRRSTGTRNSALAYSKHTDDVEMNNE